MSGGGGIENEGTMSISDSTIADNDNTSASGGGILQDGALTLANTIVADNEAAAGPDIYSEDGSLTSEGNNLIGQTNGSTGWITSDLTGTTANPLNPLLGPLANNGGPTETMALLPGSPAIDAGNNALIPAGITTDQRGPGYARVVNGNVDIGAYEVQTPVQPVASNTALRSSNPSSPYGQAVTFTATVTANGSPVTAGTVTFLDGSTILASGVPLNSNGQATYTTSTLSVPASPYVITADYSGATAFLASSNTTNQTITPVNLKFTVTDNSDSATDPNSLRYALTQIDAGGGANNTITIDPTLIGGQTITLTSPLPQITANVAINGPGASLVSVSGNNLHQVLNIAQGTTVSLTGLTATAGQSDNGGGIFSDGTTTISDCIISNNSAPENNAGGIDNSGTMTLINCTITGNSTDFGGGIFNGG